MTCSFIRLLEGTLPLPFPSHQRFFLLCPPQSLKPQRNNIVSLINVVIFTEIIYGSVSFTAVRLVCSLFYSFHIWRSSAAGSSGGQFSPQQKSAIDSQWWGDQQCLALWDFGSLLKFVCSPERRDTGKKKNSLNEFLGSLSTPKSNSVDRVPPKSLAIV